MALSESLIQIVTIQNPKIKNCSALQKQPWQSGKDITSGDFDSRCATTSYNVAQKPLPTQPPLKLFALELTTARCRHSLKIFKVPLKWSSVQPTMHPSKSSAISASRIKAITSAFGQKIKAFKV